MRTIQILILLIIFVTNCDQNKDNYHEASKRQLNNSFSQKVTKSVITLPAVIKINPDSLTTITPGENGIPMPKVVKAGKPKVIPYKVIDSVRAGTPKIVKVPEKLTIRTFGKDSTAVPKKYYIPDSGWKIQHGDTIYAPQAKIYPYPKAKKALPLRFKDIAICNIQCLDVSQGLSPSSIWSILEDKNGNLWFGTWGSGVSKYDGISFIHFGEKEGLNSYFSISMLEDRHGNLWFGTFGGVSKYDGTFFTHYSLKEGLCNNRVWSMLEDNKGNLWFGTEGGISKYDGTAFVHYTMKEGLSSNWIKSILEDRDGNLWFGTEGGVNKYDGTSFIHYSEKEGLCNNIVNSIIEDRDGNLWFGTQGGVNKYDGTSFIHYSEKEGLCNNIVNSIIEDRDGNLWFGTEGGVNEFNGKYFYNYGIKEGLVDNRVFLIFEDRSGNLWFGTEGGVSKLIKRSFNYYNPVEGFGQNRIISILEDRNGCLWFGSWLDTKYGGVNKFDGKSFFHYSDNEGLCNNWVLSILEDRDGNLWFGTFEGVSRFDGEYFTNYTVKEGLIHNWVYSILEDINGILWFATREGISKYDGKSFIHYNKKEGLCNNIVYSILEDKNGVLWFGTDAGISKFDGLSFINYTEIDDLSINGIWSMLKDKDDNLWFATEGGGVYKFDGKSFSCYTENEGLSSNFVRSILEDGAGNLWFGTDRGLTYFKSSSNLHEHTTELNKKTDKSKPVIYNLSEQDGLKESVFNYKSTILDSKNHMWLGIGKTLTMLDLNELEFSTAAPHVQLNNLEIKQSFIDYRRISESEYKKELPLAEKLSYTFKNVAGFYNYPINLKLPYYLNHLTFYFSAIDWGAPHQIQYKYILEGFDKDWSSQTKENKADYRNINPGKYIFKVKAIGISKIWSDTFEYSFIIHPPWWKTTLAYIMYIIIFILLIYSYIRWRTWRLRKEKDELEKQVKERTSQIAEQKDKIEEANEELLQQKEELQTTLENLRKTQEQLVESEKMAALGGLVAGVAHEINTPVGITITAASGLIEETKKMADLYKENKISRAEFKDYLNSANQSVKLILSNMERTASMIQSFKQVSVDQSTENKRSFKLKSYTEDVIRSLYPKLKNKKIHINLDIDEELEIDSYPGAYSQIITNLVLNSITHGFGEKDDGRIELKAIIKNGELIIEYSDNGKGISKENLKKIFNPFFTTNKKVGTGLGMHIVYNLVIQKLKGNIECFSKPGEGILFNIQVPIYSPLASIRKKQ